MALAEVKILPFTKGKKQLEKIDVDWSRELSIVRIHVERVIGVLKQKYTILQGTLPISVIADKDDQEATIDKLIRICCATSVHLLYHKIDVSLNIVKCIIYVLYNKVNICTRIQFHKTALY